MTMAQDPAPQDVEEGSSRNAEAGGLMEGDGDVWCGWLNSMGSLVKFIFT